jgi:photosystem II stability/assembly factor-like uncharacterized protein
MKKIVILFLTFQLSFLVAYSQNGWFSQSIGSSSTISSVFFYNSSTGWLLKSDTAYLVRTTNGGTNWTTYSTNSQYFVFFIDANTGWTGSNNGYVYKSTNSGINWAGTSTGVSGNVYSGYFVNTLQGWATVDSLVVKTTSGGTSWTYQLTGLGVTLNSIFFVDINTGYVSGNTGKIAKTTNGGSNWTILTSGVTNNLYSIRFANANSGWCVGASGTIRSTTNGGNTWLLSTSGTTAALRSVYFIDANTGWTAGDSGKILCTTNSGTNWVFQNSNTTNNLNSISFVTNNVGWIGGLSGTLRKTISGGTNYSTGTTVYTRNINKIFANNTIYDTINVALFSDFPFDRVVLDINAGILDVTSNPDSNITFMLIHQGITDTLVFRAGGGGYNFINTILNDSATIPIQNGSPPFTGQFKPYKPLSQFNYLPVNGTWILKIKDSLYRQERTGVIKSWSLTVTYDILTKIKLLSNEIPEKFTLEQNYPNPFNPSTKIKFQIKDSKLVTLKIYDILGKEIATLVNEKLNAGSYEVPFSVSQFSGNTISSGVYFYKLITDEFTETKKMILLK